MDNTLAMTLQPQSLEPTAEDVAMLTKQYQKALDGLYEAYRFGMMLLSVRRRLEDAEDAENGACRPEGTNLPRLRKTERAAAKPQTFHGYGYALTGDGQTAEPLQNADAPCETACGPARKIVGNNGNEMVCAGFVDAGMGDGHDAGTGDLPGSLTRETARCEQPHGGALAAPGWNRGMGLKGWLAIHCPEINYKTACRFLAVAEKTVAALALADEAEASEAAAVGSASPASPESWGEAPCASAGEGARSPFPPEAKVRAFLAGKSQRAVLRLGGARPGAGRKAKDWAAALNAAPEIAWKELSEPLDHLSDLIVRQRRHAVLTPTDLHTLRDAIDLLHEVIHADA